MTTTTTMSAIDFESAAPTPTPSPPPQSSTTSSSLSPTTTTLTATTTAPLAKATTLAQSSPSTSRVRLPVLPLALLRVATASRTSLCLVGADQSHQQQHSLATSSACHGRSAALLRNSNGAVTSVGQRHVNGAHIALDDSIVGMSDHVRNNDINNNNNNNNNTRRRFLMQTSFCIDVCYDATAAKIISGGDSCLRADIGSQYATLVRPNITEKHQIGK